MSGRVPSPFLFGLIGGLATFLLHGVALGESVSTRPGPELFPEVPQDPTQRVALMELQAANPRLLRLKAAVFDPLLHAEPDFGGGLPQGPVLRQRPVAGVYLMQFDEPVTAQIRAGVVRGGLDILGYVPNRTLVVRPRAGVTTETLLTVPGQRWTGPFLAGYKLAPDLFELLFASEPAPEHFAIDVILFPGEDVVPLAEAVQAAFDDVSSVYLKQSRPSRITFDVPAVSLAPLVGSLINDAAVQFVARRLPFEVYNDNSVWIGQSYDRTNGPAEAQQVDPRSYALSATIWNKGLTGTGQIVAVADTGLEVGMCFFEDPDHPVSPQTVLPPGPLAVDADHRKIVAYNAPFAAALTTDDTFRHGTHTAASVAGDSLTNPANGSDAGHDQGDGMAPGAKLIFEDLSGSVDSTCNTSIVVSSVQGLFEQEYAAGARISTNSWGSSAGSVHASTLEAEAATWSQEDFLVFVAAGNDGGGGIGGLAACKNCVAVGATENYDDGFLDELGTLDPENMVAFSSRGPTNNGRLKPDIVAPGFRVNSARFPVDYFLDEADPACDAGDPRVCFPGFGGCYVTDTSATCNAHLLVGTSMSSPVAAGLGALARQYLTDGFYPTGRANPTDTLVPSAALLKALLINGARNMSGRLYERRGTPQDFGPLEKAPSNVQGWGRVLLDDALYFAGDARRLYLLDLPNAQGFVTGESFQVPLSVPASDQPLKLTLVWSDPPGVPTAGGSLINDLDLRLTAPDGAVYRGNQWAAPAANVPGSKRSAPDPPGKDAVNNVEGILIASPLAGLYTVTVSASDVPGYQDFLTQGAALVVTGAVERCTSVATPQNLTVDGASSMRVELAWDPVPGALGYTMYRNGSTCSDPLTADHVVSIPAERTSHEDTDVQPVTPYNYTVRAVLSEQGCETADSNCVSVTTPAPGPPPVPDGTFGFPTKVLRPNAAGPAVVRWDTSSCPASGYHLLYGSLSTVGDLSVEGAECGLTSSGFFQWSAMPEGDLWFLVVSDDGETTEGSWGQQSDGGERGEDEPSGECGTVARDTTGVCS